MRLCLFEKDNLILTFTARLGIMTFAISEITIINSSMLPIGLRTLPNIDSQLQNSVLEIWLANRSIPNNRQGLDDYMINRYNLSFYSEILGRMMDMGHTASLLSGFYTGLDDYYVIPEKDETLCYIYEDCRFNTLHFLPKYNSYKHFLSDFTIGWSYVEKIFSSCYEYKFAPFCKSITDNVDSMFPVLAHKNNNVITFKEKMLNGNTAFLQALPELYIKLNTLFPDFRVKYFETKISSQENISVRYMETQVDVSKNTFTNIKNYILEETVRQGRIVSIQEFLDRCINQKTNQVLNDWITKYGLDINIMSFFLDNEKEKILIL